MPYSPLCTWNWNSPKFATRKQRPSNTRNTPVGDALPPVQVSAGRVVQRGGADESREEKLPR
jgi:hypothetical protein